jgi:predicted dehydrogenase
VVPLELKVLVCGAGSIGRRHAKNLVDLGVNVNLWRQRAGLLDEAAHALNVSPYKDLDRGIEDSDAVVIATDTRNHLRIAEIAASAGKHLFIEKPLADHQDGIAELKTKIEKKNLICEIGCQLRASLTLQALAKHLREGADGNILTFRGAVGHRLDQWRPGTNYRNSYSADAERGGGAVLDLIHEIDLTIWLAGSVKTVFADLRQISDHEMSAEDLANITVVLNSGSAGQLQLDMLSPVYRREFEIVTERALFRWDYVSGNVYRTDAEGQKLLAKSSDDFERNDLFLAHMTHFIQRIDDPSIPAMCSFNDGVGALDVALSIKQSGLKGKPVDIQNFDETRSRSAGNN